MASELPHPERLLDRSPGTGPQLPPTLRVWRAGPDGEVGVLELCRPDKRNAVDDVTVLGLESYFTQLDERARAVVLTADGDHFCAGLDLSQLAERTTFEGVAHSRMWHRALAAIENCPVPVISALKGAVIGGGLEIAAATHIRVADTSAYFLLPEGQHGLFVGGGGSVRIPRLIGAARMIDMMLTGRRYEGEDAAGIGLCQYVVERGDAFPAALRLALRVAANSPVTNFAVLCALPVIADSQPAQGYLIESLMAAVAQGTDDAKARMNAFLTRRSGTEAS
jgi:enoyl-CoA hydratase/carnithine racemase